ncbi:uncharacterized protein [Periplaneta americana]|uniref:uncharacterized protein n=1 Tax=Periplaneta americana TaxID=6978 RepID=UPI0037E9897C
MAMAAGSFRGKTVSPPSSSSTVTFTINGKKYTVGSEIPLDTSLNTFIREYANLKGTKIMCGEGGCGSCIVTMTFSDPITRKLKTLAVNSCLFLVLSCNGCHIVTIEGIGNKKRGYHSIQTRLAQFNGTQCGYCSPGMVMNMYSLMQDESVTMEEVENSFGGNMCRCTGYRPILDAFKSMCEDASLEIKRKVYDIEELQFLKNCNKNCKLCPNKCGGHNDSEDECDGDFVLINDSEAIFALQNIPIHIKQNGSEWFKVTSVEDIFDIFEQIGDETYMLIAGNTAKGVYPTTEMPRVYIDVQDVKELKSYSTCPTLKLGANMTLTETMKLFGTLSAMNTEYSYVASLRSHIDLVATVPVRNIGTIAGNLSLKKMHNDFPSDIFLILETVGAKLDIAYSKTGRYTVSLQEFLDMDMKNKVILSVSLPPLSEKYKLKTYKIMPRAQNAHALVNAGFLFNLDMKDNARILQRPRIVFGAINPQRVHANLTETYLNNQCLFEPDVLRTALDKLDNELTPDNTPPDPSPKFKKTLALSLFYKSVLSLGPPRIPKTLQSGGTNLFRPLSSGKQYFNTDKSEWPLNKPIPKLEAIYQTSGEAEYVNDIPSRPGELHAAYVLSNVAQGFISGIDTSEALNIPGVQMFISASDIPGENTFTPKGMRLLTEDEEIFCSGNVKYAGQPIGIVVADSLPLAQEAASKVVVQYTDVQPPHLNMRDVIRSGDSSRILPATSPPTLKSKEFKSEHRVIKGSFDLGSQYAFAMENQIALCIPIEDGMDVYVSTQWIDLIQVAIAKALNVRENSVNVKVRRVGGAYGAKVSRASAVATACAVAAHILNRPVRFVLDLVSNMKALGKRCDFSMDYEVTVDDTGKIQNLKADLYENAGCSWNEPIIYFSLHSISSCYDTSNWEVNGSSIMLDVPSTTFCRAPGNCEGIAAIENIMEHIATVLNMDPIDIRLRNMSKDCPMLPQMVQELKNLADYSERKRSIDEFNQNERWKKKGISLSVMKFDIEYLFNYQALVSIYAVDGSVAVSHGGIECGQGINTKVAQVVA